ncbi:MAG: uracil-DNA glycosylase [Candidatus Planktophila sp.]
MSFSLKEVHPSWQPFFATKIGIIQSILESLEGIAISPARENIFRAFRYPLNEVKVVIVGQDPYPGEGIADGLAFSSQEGQAIPASLRNIFTEYSNDLNLPRPNNPDLTRWAENGVLLLNRTLTTAVGERNAHLDSEWKALTFDIAQYLSSRKVVAILWGNYAKELASIFSEVVESPHPSPLSARRGFFGSKPFSRANEILIGLNREPVDWMLQ